LCPRVSNSFRRARCTATSLATYVSPCATAVSQGKISSEELVAIVTVYETASATDDVDDYGEHTERYKFLTDLEATLGDSASPGILSAVQSAKSSDAPPDAHRVSISLERAMAQDLAAAGAASDPFDSRPGASPLVDCASPTADPNYFDPSSVAPQRAAVEPAAESGATPHPATSTSSPKGSPGKSARKKGKKKKVIWTWADATRWLVRTYELPQTECDARMSELVRFGFADADAAEALVETGGDVDAATVLLVAQS
jgi:hypothetical protein